MKDTIRCPHCQRPFVDWDYAADHVKRCRERRQQKLDHGWIEKQEQRKT
jgi:hypothetical protein